ncbi:hypothetical protein BC628DRAFT_976199 [Trametes gibbosa]|nr:hypothetical protein BC628DRAFT_976199 [Trametes gibbosa]
MTHTPSTPYSLAATTLHDPDILHCLFDTLEFPSGKKTRRTLARCALVCTSWLDPASRILWRRLDSFIPLWALLIGHSFPAHDAERQTGFWKTFDSEDFVKERLSREPELWKAFLRRASHVREVGRAACEQPQLMLLRSVVEHNGRCTFLPNLQSIVWRSGVPDDKTLLSLVSPALRDLDFNFTRFAAFGEEQSIQSSYAKSTSDFAELLAGLSKAAPYLTRLVVTRRYVGDVDIVPILTGLVRLRELTLNGDIMLTPEELRTLLVGVPSLQKINVYLKESAFVVPGCFVRSTSLRSLHLRGLTQDFVGLFSSFLEAPHIDSLALEAPHTTNLDHTPSLQRYLDTLSKASFAPTLRVLTMSTTTRQHIVHEDEPPEPEPGVLAALFGPLAAFRNLEQASLTITDGSPCIGDADLLALARAWPRLRRLALSYAPANARILPPLTALHHFAAHCPDLRDLSLSRMTVPPVVGRADAVALVGAGAGAGTGAARLSGHALQRLDLRLTFVATRTYDVPGIAGFLDALFPHLDLGEEDADAGRRVFAAMTGTWGSVRREIRRMKLGKLSEGVL